MYRFNTWDEADFGVAFPIAFATTGQMNYSEHATAMKVGKCFICEFE